MTTNKEMLCKYKCKLCILSIRVMQYVIEKLFSPLHLSNSIYFLENIIQVLNPNIHICCSNILNQYVTNLSLIPNNFINEIYDRKYFKTV